MMMNAIVAAIAIAGVVLNIKKKWQGFVCWTFSNAWWSSYTFGTGETVQGILYLVFAAFSIYGIYAWRIRPSVLLARLLKRVPKSHGMSSGDRIRIKGTSNDGDFSILQDDVMARIRTVCRRILTVKSDLDEGRTRVKVNWLVDEANEILEVIENGKEKNSPPRRSIIRQVFDRRPG